MNNLALFVNGLLEYLVVYGVFIAAILIAFFIGFSLRKAKNAKLASAQDTPDDNAKN